MKPNGDDYLTIPYSDPERCDPELLYLREDRLRERELRLRLTAPAADVVYLHLYNATARTLQLQVFGIGEDGEGRPLVPETETAAVAYRQPIKVGRGRFRELEVHLRVEREDGASEGAHIALAAYAGEEPASKGNLSQGIYDPCAGKKKSSAPNQRVQLPFDCRARATQRLILSSCDAETDLQEWVALTGLTVSEAYYGSKGSVVALGVPPGMSLNTAGGSVAEIRAKANAPGGSVTEDYLVNLFNPRQPADGDGAQPRLRTPPGISDCEARADYDQNLEPVVVAIIDSGVDDSAANRDRWEASRYRQRAESEFIRPWQLGYDFMDKDAAPEDVAKHGTSVAATLLSQYRGKRPLNLVHLKTFGAGGISTYFGALVSIYEAATIGADIINMSWGIYGEQPPPGLECAIRTAIGCGVRIVTSAGNDGKDLGCDPQWPAAFAADPRYAEQMISVASFGPDRPGVPGDLNDVHLSSYSNYGDRAVSLAAFMTAGVPEHGTGQTIYPLGTSISAPLVAGKLADWLADHPRGTVTEFCNTFCQQSPHLKGRTVDARYLPVGGGRVRPELSKARVYKVNRVS